MDEEKKKKKESEINPVPVDTASPNTNNDEGPEWLRSTPNYSFRDTSKGTSTDYGTYQNDLNRLAEAQKTYQIAELRKARDSALNSLKEQEQEIKPTYQNARNMTSAASQSGARSFAEYLANRGLTNSGAAAQGEINRQSALQNNLGNIDTAEANAYRDIANQRTKVNTDYANGLASANAAIQQQYLQNLLNYNEQQRQYVQNLQNQSNYQYANDYQSRINDLLAQGYSPNSLEVLQLQALRGDKMNNSYANANTPQNALASIQAGNINYNNAAALGWTPEQAQTYYNNYQAQLQAQAQAQAEQQAWDRYVEQTKLNNATALNNAQIANYSSQIANRGKTSSSSTNKVANYSTHKDIIDSNFAGTDWNGGTVYDKQGIANYITQELADDAIDKTDARSLASKYGLNYYQLTPEYQEIKTAMWNTTGKEYGDEILKAYKEINPNVDEKIFDQLEKDWNELYK